MKHKHADLMMQYAQDATTTDQPWELWNLNTGNGWVVCCQNPFWDVDTEYYRQTQPAGIHGTVMSADIVFSSDPCPVADNPDSIQEDLMKYDPATGEEKPYPSHAAQWRLWHGKMTAWLFNPWTGKVRHAGDVGSDTFGKVIAK